MVYSKTLARLAYEHGKVVVDASLEGTHQAVVWFPDDGDERLFIACVWDYNEPEWICEAKDDGDLWEWLCWAVASVLSGEDVVIEKTEECLRISSLYLDINSGQWRKQSVEITDKEIEEAVEEMLQKAKGMEGKPFEEIFAVLTQ